MCAFFANLLNVPTEPEAKPFKDPIFLIGLMRSGTTLLMNTLSEHPQLLKAGFEMNKAWTEIGGAPCSVNCDERTEADFDPVFANNMTAYFTRYIEESKGFLRHLARWSAKRYYGSGAVFYDWENLYLMNKSPHLSNKIRYLNKIYPNAKYIVIVRSPFGQCASLKMHFLKVHKQSKLKFNLPIKPTSCWNNVQENKWNNFNKERLFPENSSLLGEAWLRLNKSIFTHLEEVPEENQIYFTYERFVNNKPEVLSQIFRFLELDKKHQRKEIKILSKNPPIQNTSTKGDPLTKWSKFLTFEEQKQIAIIINRSIEDYNYIKSKLNQYNSSEINWPSINQI